MQARLETLRTRFRKMSRTGANTRLLNPEKVSTYEDICQIERLLIKVKPLSPPTRIEYVEIGHKIVLICKKNNKEILHLCTGLDVIYHMDNQFGGRLISIDSRVGREIVGKSQGEMVTYLGKKCKIDEISVSEYLR